MSDEPFQLPAFTSTRDSLAMETPYSSMVSKMNEQRAALKLKKEKRAKRVAYAKDLLTTTPSEVVSFGKLALNEATFGLNDRIAADVANVGNKLISGTGENTFTEEYTKRAIANKVHSENVGTIGTVAAGLLGSAPKLSGPGMISEAARWLTKDSLASGRLSNNLLRVMGRMGRESGVAVTENSINNFIEGELPSVLEVGANIGIGAAGQAVIGELFPKFVRSGLVPLKNVIKHNTDKLNGDPVSALEVVSSASPAASTRIHSSLFRTGSKTDADDGIVPLRDGQNPLSDGITVNGEEISPQEYTDRLASTIANTTFPTRQTATREFSQKFADRYTAAIENVYGYMNEVKDNINKTVDTAFQPVTSRMEIMQNRATDPKYQLYGKVYNELGSSASKIGGQTIPYHSAVAEFDAAFLKDSNGNAIQAVDASQAEQDVRNAAINLIRPDVLNKHVRTTQRGVHAGDNPLSNSVDLDTAEVPLSKLFNARREIATTFSRPGQTFLPGMNTNTQHTLASVKVLKALDDVISARVGGLDEKARKGFAQYLKTENAYLDGVTFYRSNLDEEELTGASFDEYVDKLQTENPDAYDAFKAGYVSAFGENIKEYGIARSMTNLFGEGALKDVDGKIRYDPDNIITQPTAEAQRLTRLLGKGRAKALFEQLQSSVEDYGAKARLINALASKEFDNNAINDIVRQSDDVIFTLGITPHQQTAMSSGFLQSAGRLASASSPKDARIQLELINTTGDDFNRGMQQIDNAATTPTAKTGAGRFLDVETNSAVENEADRNVAAARRDTTISDAKESITDYLQSIVGQE